MKTGLVKTFCKDFVGVFQPFMPLNCTCLYAKVVSMIYSSICVSVSVGPKDRRSWRRKRDELACVAGIRDA